MPRRHRVTIRALDGTVIRTMTHYTRFGARRAAGRAAQGAERVPNLARRHAAAAGLDPDVIPPRQWLVEVDRES